MTLAAGLTVSVLLAAHAGARAAEPDLIVESGLGNFAFTPPKDAAKGWWASVAYDLCLGDGIGGGPVELESIELEQQVAAEETRFAVVTSTRLDRDDPTGTATGLPRETVVDGEPMIVWPGSRPIAGTVRPVEGVRISRPCADPPASPRLQSLIVSLRTDTAGADITSLRVTYRQGGRLRTSEPYVGRFIACGDAVRVMAGGRCPRRG
ncbi:hypothetical protein GCM10027425_04470 [Alteromonas gracilis]